MPVVLVLFSIVSFAAGALIFFAAKSAIHEIEAFVLFLVAATFLASSAVVDAIRARKKDLVRIASLLEQIQSLLATRTAPQSSLVENPPIISQEPGFYVKLESGTEGPFMLSYIRELLEKDVLTRDTSVQAVGTSNWQSVDSLQNAEKG